jgi:hypothetical protein
MRITFGLAVLVGFMASSCGIFDPRPAEYPSSAVAVDPFNFGQIVVGTGKPITKVAYNDIFFDSATFVDINDNVFERKMLVDHLQDASTRYAIDVATWSPDSLKDFSIGDTFFVDRSYHVAMRDTMMIPPTSYVFDNSASLKLIFNANKNTWSIFYFKDKFPGRSIFHPLFQPNY